MAAGKYYDFTVIRLSLELLLAHMLHTHRDVTKQRKKKKTGQEVCEVDYYGLLLGRLLKSWPAPNWVARCLDLGIAVSALIQLILL